MKFLVCAAFVIQFLLQSCGTWGNKWEQIRTKLQQDSNCRFRWSRIGNRQGCLEEQPLYWRSCPSVLSLQNAQCGLGFGLSRSLFFLGWAWGALCALWPHWSHAKEGSPCSLPVGKEVALFPRHFPLSFGYNTIFPLSPTEGWIASVGSPAHGGHSVSSVCAGSI